MTMPLEQLWAGWRNAYVSETTDAERRGDDRPERGVALEEAVARVRDDVASRRTAPGAPSAPGA